MRTRQRKTNRQDQYQKLDDEKEWMEVREQGLKFKINLTDYLDTGLFLDHRMTRAMVRAGSADKKVLNLFCYTGSFSVYAAAGGATEVVSVDLSKTYLKWATENMDLNGFYDPARHRYIHEDVKQWLETLPAAYFDLVMSLEVAEHLSEARAAIDAGVDLLATDQYELLAQEMKRAR
jgi:23S rRNA (cytosine1962-C5)-methyltransferase